MMLKHWRVLIVLSIFLFSFNFVLGANFGYNNPYLPKLVPDETTTESGNITNIYNVTNITNNYLSGGAGNVTGSGSAGKIATWTNETNLNWSECNTATPYDDDWINGTIDQKISDYNLTAWDYIIQWFTDRPNYINSTYISNGSLITIDNINNFAQNGTNGTDGLNGTDGINGTDNQGGWYNDSTQTNTTLDTYVYGDLQTNKTVTFAGGDYSDCARLTTNAGGLVVCAGMELYVLISDLVSYVGNWSLDRPNYINTTWVENGTLVTASNLTQYAKYNFTDNNFRGSGNITANYLNSSSGYIIDGTTGIAYNITVLNTTGAGSPETYFGNVTGSGSTGNIAVWQNETELNYSDDFYWASEINALLSYMMNFTLEAIGLNLGNWSADKTATLNSINESISQLAEANAWNSTYNATYDAMGTPQQAWNWTYNETYDAILSDYVNGSMLDNLTIIREWNTSWFNNSDLYYNSSGLLQNWSNIITGGAGGDPYPAFQDQYVNTTSDVKFNLINTTTGINMNNNTRINLSDDGSVYILYNGSNLIISG